MSAVIIRPNDLLELDNYSLVGAEEVVAAMIDDSDDSFIRNIDDNDEDALFALDNIDTGKTYNSISATARVSDATGGKGGAFRINVETTSALVFTQTFNVAGSASTSFQNFTTNTTSLNNVSDDYINDLRVRFIASFNVLDLSSIFVTIDSAGAVSGLELSAGLLKLTRGKVTIS